MKIGKPCHLERKPGLAACGLEAPEHVASKPCEGVDCLNCKRTHLYKAMAAFDRVANARRAGATPRKLAKWTCPACKSRTTKILNLSTGLARCQACDHQWKP